MSDDEIKEEKKEVKLSRKELAFIYAYLSGPSKFDATKAARVAGYKDNENLHTNAAGLLQKTTIKAEIDRLLEESALSRGAVLAGLSDIANGDVADFMEITPLGFNISLLLHDAKGDLLRDANGQPIRNPKTKLIKKLKQRVTTINAKGENGEDREIIETEIELYSAHDAYRDMGKHHKLFTDNVTVGNPDGSALIPVPDKEADARHDRALSSLADAIRASIPGAGAEPDSAVDAAE